MGHAPTMTNLTPIKKISPPVIIKKSIICLWFKLLFGLISNCFFIVNTSTLNQIFSKLSKAIPAPQSDLQFVNHYTLLVAVVLSAQSTDAQVNKATKDLFAKYDTPEKILKLGLKGIIPYVKSIGLFNSKAKNVIALSQIPVSYTHLRAHET